MNAQQPLCKGELSLNKWRVSLQTHLKWWGQVFLNDSPSTLGNVPPESCWVLPAQVRQYWPGVPLPRVCTSEVLGHVCKTTHPKNHSKIACAAQSSAVTWPKRELGSVQQLVTPAREQLVFALDKPGTGITRLQKDPTRLSSTLEIIHLGPKMLPKKFQCSTPSEMSKTLFCMR